MSPVGGGENPYIFAGNNPVDRSGRNLSGAAVAGGSAWLSWLGGVAREVVRGQFSAVDLVTGSAYGTTGDDYIHYLNPANDFTDSADTFDRVMGVGKIAGWVTAGTAGGLALGTSAIGGTLLAAGFSSATATGVGFGLSAAGASYGIASGLHQTRLSNPSANVTDYTIAAALGGFSGGASPFGALGNAIGSGIDYAMTGNPYGRGYRIGGMIGDIAGSGGLAALRGRSLAYAMTSPTPHNRAKH